MTAMQRNTRRQAGAALLAAMLTVTLVASLAATALWQQWRSIEVESAERSRLQSLWVLTGALDWARLILREDARSGGADHLAEPWAIPLAEARLSTFLSADKSSTVDNDETLPQAFLSGGISDLQARLNVRNLIEGTKLSGPDVKAFAKLFTLLGLPPTELTTLANNLRLALDTNAASDLAAWTPVLPQRVDQLVWLGLSPRSLALLRPHITVLPVRTPININTASATVLYAGIALLDMAQAKRLVNARQVAHFRTLADAGTIMANAPGQLTDTQHSVNSHFFEVLGRLRLDQAVVVEQSVVQREGLDVTVLWRDRGANPVPTMALEPAL